jgi:hypothetical protein
VDVQLQITGTGIRRTAIPTHTRWDIPLGVQIIVMIYTELKRREVQFHDFSPQETLALHSNEMKYIYLGRPL